MQNGIDVWLDDERDPKESRWAAKGAHPEMVWVQTVEAAIELLQAGNVRSISLDNDLGYHREGYEVADWIEQAAFEGRLKEIRLYAHTDNTVRKQYMKAAFRSAKRAWQGARVQS